MDGRFKALRVNNCQARLRSSAKLYFITDGEIGEFKINTN